MDKTRDEVAVRPLEVAISIDTTVSMYHCLEEVREDVQDLVHRLYSDIEGEKRNIFIPKILYIIMK